MSSKGEKSEKMRDKDTREIDLSSYKKSGGLPTAP
jgi:hypothetical protein